MCPSVKWNDALSDLGYIQVEEKWFDAAFEFPLHSGLTPYLLQVGKFEVAFNFSEWQ
jgi:hypothetical protein